MKNFIKLYFFIALQAGINTAIAGTTGYDTTKVQTNFQKECFYSAKNEIEAMLSGNKPLDYERAIFITENAFYENQISYSLYKSLLDKHTLNILNLSQILYTQHEGEYKPTLLQTEDELKENYRKLISNEAIYTYLTDTTYGIGRDNSHRENLPYQYSSNDPLGTKNWNNSQVLNLLAQKRGNCYAMTSLFKILSLRFESEADICTAPGHIFIVHNDLKGNSFNIELANKAFPGSGSIKAYTNTTHEAVINGISMRPLNLKESVALTLIYLAKGYEQKFGKSNDQFGLDCAELVLKYDQKSLNAMLLKSQILEQELVEGMKTNNLKEVKGISKLPSLNSTFVKYENLISELYKLGYRETPVEIKNLIISRMMNDESYPFFVKDQTPNPFKHIKSNPKDTRYATLSSGVFDEIHEDKGVEKYSMTIFNTKTKRIEKFVAIDSLYNNYPYDPVVFAWNIDPLAHKYPSLSPYAFVANNPIYFVDKDGAVIWDPQAKKEVVYNSESKKFSYKDGTELSKSYQKAALPTLQKLSSSEVGVKLIQNMQAISTRINIDETDKEAIRNAPMAANSVVVKGEAKNSDGLFTDVQISPNWKNINANAAKDNMDVDEKLLATMMVEFGHFGTKGQIDTEDRLGHDNIYSNSSAFAEVYNPLLNNAIRAEIAYRTEKGQAIDASVFNPIMRVQQSAIGKDLKLDESNQKAYDAIKK